MRARVYIATTEGPVLVQRLAPEAGLAEAELSAVCLDGTPTRLPITGAYTYFVRDHVRALSGGAAYRMDLDRRIDGGSSWMLGAWTAHLLLSEGRLAVGDETADTAVYATGEVAVAADAERRDEIRPVDYVADKIARLAESAAEEAAGGRRVLLLVPQENAAEAETALRDLPVPERPTLRLAADTDDVRRALWQPGDAESTQPRDAESTQPGDAALASPADAAATPSRPGRGKRRRGGRVAALLALGVLLGAGAAGYAVWHNAEGEWERLRREGRYLELARSLDGFFVPMAAQRFRDRWRGQGDAAGFAVTVAARRPADGGSCSGMRFRRVSLVASPVTPSGPVFRLDRPRSLCGFAVGAASHEAAGGHAWVSLNLVPAHGAPAVLVPARKVLSGVPAESPVELSQDLPLYLQDHWAWTVTGVWAPRPSQDVADLLEAGDAEALAALKDLGLTVVRARIELAR